MRERPTVSGGDLTIRAPPAKEPRLASRSPSRPPLTSLPEPEEAQADRETLQRTRSSVSVTWSARWANRQPAADFKLR
jgi:hypothetical protein